MPRYSAISIGILAHNKTVAFLLPKSVFIHTPKTGGQWVTASLERAGLLIGQLGVVHTLPSEVREMPEFRARQFSFAFVRHPLAWYQSMWAHRMDEAWDAIDDPDWIPSDTLQTWESFSACRSDDFNQFVVNCMDRFPNGFVSQLYDKYTEDCNFIGKQEDVENELIRILDSTGEVYNEQSIRSTPPRNVRGRRRTNRTRYSMETIELVANAEEQALTHFQYELDIERYT